MSKFKVEVDHNLCIGCVTCKENCSNFELDQNEEGLFKSSPLVGEIHADTHDIEAHQLAVDECPVNCISMKKI